MNQVDFDIRNNVAVINMIAPPVNSLGLPMREAILESFHRACSDENVKAIVISSAGKLFCGGADISEFGTNLPFTEPSLPSLCSILEASDKIIVGAINGMALGGGCELALACDYRIAMPQAKMGLPEVALGILPGAGGTQRMPRLAGVELALDMVVSGKPVSAGKLFEAGAIDRLYDLDGGDSTFLEEAIAYAIELVDSAAELKTCADISIDNSSLSDSFFDDYRAAIARRSRGFYAPERCIQAIEAACNLPLSEGLRKEGELFKECMNTPQARAQQHVFFAERAATKIPGVDSKAPIRDIKKVAIIGSGTMGGGIAMNFINAGIETTLLDLNAEALKQGISVIQNNYDISVKKGRFTQEQVDQTMDLLDSTTNYADISDADLVIEAVFEKMEIKKQVFQTLDEVCKSGAILATNTSTLDVNEIADVTKRPEDVIGLHFFSPANVMRLLEIVRGDKTANDVLLTAIKTAKKIGKSPAVAGVCWGFIGNRMLEPYGRETYRLILEGATAAQIDRVLYDFGLAMGYPSMIDLAGIDVGYMTRHGNEDALYSRDPAYSIIGDKLYELGRYGQKTGRGFYIYDGRDKQEDPEVESLAIDLAKELGIKRREISDQEILERTMYVLINEGAQILDEGIAYRAGDIDIVYCYGYAFPAHKGGPMQYADETGLDTVLAGINKYRHELGEYGEEWFKPAPLLESMAAENKRFND